MRQARTFLLLPLLALAWACGGQSLSTTGDDDSAAGGDSGKGGSSNTGGTSGEGGSGGSGAVGGASTGGTGAVGGTGASGGSGAFGGTGIGGSGQCTAFPSCQFGETQVPGPEYCNPGATCHQESLCGATIWCTGQPLCDAIPVCDAGDEAIAGTCPPDGTCYTRTVCGQTLQCLDHCNPDTEPDRQYLLTSCGPGDMWACSSPATKSFVNECGCGCEQDPSCPDNLYCTLPIALDRAAPPGDAVPTPNPAPPGGTAPAPCTDEQLAACPFSDAFNAERP